jgi:hypothetical protein
MAHKPWRENQSDADFIASLDDIKTPREALECLDAHTQYYGDPYYTPLVAAVDRMVDRVLKENPA